MREKLLSSTCSSFRCLTIVPENSLVPFRGSSTKKNHLEEGAKQNKKHVSVWAAPPPTPPPNFFLPKKEIGFSRGGASRYLVPLRRPSTYTVTLSLQVQGLFLDPPPSWTGQFRRCFGHLSQMNFSPSHFYPNI